MKACPEDKIELKILIINNNQRKINILEVTSVGGVGVGRKSRSPGGWWRSPGGSSAQFSVEPPLVSPQ